MKSTLLLIFLSILSSTVTQLPKDCYDEYKNLTHPFKCCRYPYDYQSHIFKECGIECQNDKNSSICIHDCFHKKSKIYEDGKINDEKLAEAFKFFDYKPSDGEMKQWKEVIPKSIEKCHNYWNWTSLDLPKSNGSTPIYLAYFFCCIMQENFLNCPTFNYTTQCNATRAAVENQNGCGFKHDGKKITRGLVWFPWEEEKN